MFTRKSTVFLHCSIVRTMYTQIKTYNNAATQPYYHYIIVRLLTRRLRTETKASVTRKHSFSKISFFVLHTTRPQGSSFKLIFDDLRTLYKVMKYVVNILIKYVLYGLTKLKINKISMHVVKYVNTFTLHVAKQ